MKLKELLENITPLESDIDEIADKLLNGKTIVLAQRYYGSKYIQLEHVLKIKDNIFWGYRVLIDENNEFILGLHKVFNISSEPLEEGSDFLKELGKYLKKIEYFVFEGNNKIFDKLPAYYGGNETEESLIERYTEVSFITELL